MTQQLVKYTEQLEDDELAFLHRRVDREVKQYYRIAWLLMILSFIIPFTGAWYRAVDGAPNAFSMPRFFATAFVLVSLSCGGMYVSYRVSLRKILADIKQGTKTIEQAHITKKTFVPSNDTYYFYLDSPNKLSIEVNASDFHSMSQGDEISIEYTTNSRLYLGYF